MAQFIVSAAAGKVFNCCHSLCCIEDVMKITLQMTDIITLIASIIRIIIVIVFDPVTVVTLVGCHFYIFIVLRLIRFCMLIYT